MQAVGKGSSRAERFQKICISKTPVQQRAFVNDRSSSPPISSLILVLPSKMTADTDAPTKLTVLISGSGTNLQALIDACASSPPALASTSIVRVISNRKSAYGLERAQAAGIPTAYHNLVPYAGKYPSSDPSTKYGAAAREAYDADLAELVLRDAPDLVVCAGWMHIVSPVFLTRLERSGVQIIK